MPLTAAQLVQAYDNSQVVDEDEDYRPPTFDDPLMTENQMREVVERIASSANQQPVMNIAPVANSARIGLALNEEDVPVIDWDKEFQR